MFSSLISKKVAEGLDGLGWVGGLGLAYCYKTPSGNRVNNIVILFMFFIAI